MESSTHVPPGGRSAEEDALHQVLNIEREAQAILEEAEEEAASLIASAREQAAARVRGAEQAAQQQAQTALAQALEEAQQQATQIIASTEASMAQWEQAAQRNLPEAVRLVCSLVAFPQQVNGGHRD